MALAPAHSATSGGPSEELQRHINQNLIMSPAQELGSSFAAASAAALTAPQSASAAASSSSSLSSSSSSASGSSITSFDSNNLIDDKRLPQSPHQHQQHQQQQLEQLQMQQHSRIQAKDTAGPYPIPIPAHRPEPVENHLESTHGIDGTDNVFGTPMYFGTENSTLVTTQIGATAHVPCTVHHIGEGVVSKPTHAHLLDDSLAVHNCSPLHTCANK